MHPTGQLDSTLMLWGYAMPDPGEENWRTLWRKKEDVGQDIPPPVLDAEEKSSLPTLETEATSDRKGNAEQDSSGEISEVNDPKITEAEDVAEKDLEKNLQAEVKEGHMLDPAIQPAKARLYSELSIVLTIISIIVAFAISIIEFMGIAIEKCSSCADAAENSSGLDGRWWRFWQACNDSSGYIGAGIVGVMLLCGAVYIGLRKYRRRQATKLETPAKQDENDSAP